MIKTSLTTLSKQVENDIAGEGLAIVVANQIYIHERQALEWAQIKTKAFYEILSKALDVTPDAFSICVRADEDENGSADLLPDADVEFDASVDLIVTTFDGTMLLKEFAPDLTDDQRALVCAWVDANPGSSLPTKRSKAFKAIILEVKVEK